LPLSTVSNRNLNRFKFFYLFTDVTEFAQCFLTEAPLVLHATTMTHAQLGLCARARFYTLSPPRRYAPARPQQTFVCLLPLDYAQPYGF
jgi:hypothetical protein